MSELEPELVLLTLAVPADMPSELVAAQAVAAFEGATDRPGPLPPVPEPPPTPEPGPATGAQAGKPGLWGYGGPDQEFVADEAAIVPKSPTALRAGDPVEVTPYPAVRWQKGEYLQTANQTQSGWAWFDGETWRSGKTP